MSRYMTSLPQYVCFRCINQKKYFQQFSPEKISTNYLRLILNFPLNFQNT